MDVSGVSTLQRQAFPHDPRKGLVEGRGKRSSEDFQRYAVMPLRACHVGERGGGMIPFCCSFSPQNPVGTRLVQMGEQGVAVNMKVVDAY